MAFGSVLNRERGCLPNRPLLLSVLTLTLMFVGVANAYTYRSWAGFDGFHSNLQEDLDQEDDGEPHTIQNPDPKEVKCVHYDDLNAIGEFHELGRRRLIKRSLSTNLQAVPDLLSMVNAIFVSVETRLSAEEERTGDITYLTEDCEIQEALKGIQQTMKEMSDRLKWLQR